MISTLKISMEFEAYFNIENQKWQWINKLTGFAF